MSQLKSVDFSEVYQEGQETGIKALANCSPDVNFQVVEVRHCIYNTYL